MNILVAKNGSQLGPFSETDIRAKLASGEFAPTDFGWHEGLTAWSPLSQLLVSDPAPSPLAPPLTPSAPAQGAYAPQPYAAPQGNVPGGYAPQPANSPYPAAYQPGMTPAWGAQGASNYAGFWLRFVAYLIDAIVLAIPTFIVLLVLGAALRVDAQAANFFGRAINIFLGWPYYAYMESSKTQATLGKLILGLKVTDENGNRIGFGQASGRYWGMLVSGIIIGVGFMMAGFTQRKQALHDIMAHTLVVRK